ncbi:MULTISPECIES: cytoplasmic protein [unclassified Leifsonia]|uniref:cytoplasmic protein n=1 Tax=unclassified Leifsonia TaxID=2663824 RepID=UPI001442B376|nr:cytoplasmic protein [Leifsonia sp. PS1209]QIZ97528.1 cytoplasmic protein [Leifsonia sp. PS1209]
MVTDDPLDTDPDNYHLLWENEYVRVLEYLDAPGLRTNEHDHPNSVLVALSEFDRHLRTPDKERTVHLDAGEAVWLPAQRHSGENVGTTPTHTLLIELKGDAAGDAGTAGAGTAAVGPSTAE